MKPQVIHEVKESYNMRQQKGRNEVVAPTTWGADWDYFGAADCCHHTLCPHPCCLQEALIITQTHSCCWLGIWFPHHISHQVQFSPIVLIMLLHLSPASAHSQWGFPLLISVHLFSLTLSRCALFGVSSQNFKLLSMLILAFLTHTFNSQKIKDFIK